MNKLSKLLESDDRETLTAESGTTWIPKKPIESLRPYVSDEETEEDLSDLDKIRQKAKNVMDGYNNVIEKCKKLEADIETRSKDVKVTLSRQNNLRVMEALGRIFGQGLHEEITFEMYKICVQEMAKLNNDSTPKPPTRGEE